ncbi:MAG: hypothetical protein WC564_04680 [Patescibacteria group bacterium]|jgi:hypothetical protein
MNQIKNQSSLGNSEPSGFEQKPVINALSQQQKVSLISLGAFTVLVMIFGVLQFRYNLYSPFEYSRNIVATQKTVDTPLDKNNTDLTKMDSDDDGLNDFDEINIYNTSPYLEDSDSDGFSDKDEILNSTDPNCPAGQVCALISAPVDSTPDTPSSLDGAASGITQEEQTAKDMLSGKSDPAVLRKLLLDNGMAQADLDKISDEELVASYQESLKNQEAAQE